MPVMVGTPVGQEGLNFQASPSGLVKPDFQASPSGLVKQDLNFKVEGYVEHSFEYDLKAGEKVLDPSVSSPTSLKVVGLIPALPEEEPEHGSPAPSAVEINIDGLSATVRLFDADGLENSAERPEAEIAQVVEFLNDCAFSGPEPSEYDLSPKFLVGDEGKLVAKTGEYVTYVDIPIVTKITLRDPLDEGIAKNSATMWNSEGKLLILPYQAIELAQRRDSLVKNITETRLTKLGSNFSIYNIKSFERLSFLDLITFETEIETVIDAVTGRTLKQPWFSKFPSWIIQNIA